MLVARLESIYEEHVQRRCRVFAVGLVVRNSATRNGYWCHPEPDGYINTRSMGGEKRVDSKMRCLVGKSHVNAARVHQADGHVLLEAGISSSVQCRRFGMYPRLPVHMCMSGCGVCFRPPHEFLEFFRCRPGIDGGVGLRDTHFFAQEIAQSRKTEVQVVEHLLRIDAWCLHETRC